MSTLLFATIHSTRMKTGIALSADHFVTVILLSQKSQAGFNDPTTQPEHKVKSGLFLDVVIRKCPAIFQLLASKNQTLLVWGNSFFVLNFSFHIFDRITWFHLKGDGLTRQSFDEDLHSLVKVTLAVNHGA